LPETPALSGTGILGFGVDKILPYDELYRMFK